METFGLDDVRVGSPLHAWQADRVSMLAREAAEVAEGARRQIVACRDRLVELAARLRADPPAFVATGARGSSDHAALYGKYVLETTVGRAVASIGPSVVTTEHATLELSRALFVAVSQSGRSPDLIRLAEAARASGALVVGMINDEASPLAACCEVVLPLCAGTETSVAATKSCLLAGLAFVQLAAAWTDDPELRAAVARAPDALAAAAALDWRPALLALASAQHLYVVGRALSLGIANEIALKLKETCALHAEAFSAAEVMHGPIALVGPGFPILALDGPAGPKLRAPGGLVVDALPEVPGVPDVLAPLCQLQSFYLALPDLARARGLDADAPRHLQKVTETL